MKKSTFLSFRTLYTILLFLFFSNVAFSQHDPVHPHQDTLAISHEVSKHYTQVAIGHPHTITAQEGHSISPSHHYSNELNDFKVIANEEHISLHWEVMSNNHNKGFEVQHSLDGENWNTLGIVEAKSSDHHGHAHYHFIVDELESDHHIFRLKHLRKDNHLHYCHPISIELDIQETHRLVSILPNHFHKDFHMSLSLNHSQKVAIHLMDKDGHSVSTLFEGKLSDHAIYSVSFTLEDFSSNSHNVQIHGEKFHFHHHLTEKTN